MDKIPWVNQYTPIKIKNLAIDDNMIKYFEKIVKTKKINNLLLIGQSGSCKTATIECFINELYGEDIDKYIYKITLANCNIKKIINTSIIKFCENHYNKIIIIENLDKIQDRLQDTILNIMNKFENTTKFIFTCSEIQNIGNGIQTKCEILKFNGIKKEKMEYILTKMCEYEKVELINRENIINQIIINSNGDLRYAINLLQQISYQNKKEINDISEIFGWTNIEINDKIIKYIIDKNYISLIEIIKDIYKQYGGLNIIYGLRLYLLTKKDFNEEIKMEILYKISKLELELFSNGDNIILLLDGLIN